MSVDLKKLMALSDTVAQRSTSLGETKAKRDIQAWCKKNIKAQAGSTAVYLYEDIGDWGISAMDLVEVINGISTPIVLHVNSNGGSVKDGIAMYNAIRNHPSHFTGIVDGFAASAASVVVLACDVVQMEKASRMMIHDAGVGGMYIEGNAKQFRDAVKDVEEMANLLDDLSNMIAQIYVDKAGGTVAAWRETMSNDKWYSADEAIEAGLADSLAGEEPDPDNKIDAAPTASAASAEPAQPETWDVEGLRNALKGAFA